MTISDIRKELGISRTTFDKHMKRPEAPPATGRKGVVWLYDGPAVMDYIRRRQKLDNRAPADESITELRREKLREEIATLRFKREAEQGKWLSRETAEHELLSMAATVKARFLTLENSLPPLLENKPALDVAGILHAAIYDCLREIADEARTVEDTRCRDCPHRAPAG